MDITITKVVDTESLGQRLNTSVAVDSMVALEALADIVHMDLVA